MAGMNLLAVLHQLVLARKRLHPHTQPLNVCTRYRTYHVQCCGSGSGIQCLFDPWIQEQGRVKNPDPDPGWVKNQDPYPGSGICIRDEQPGSYFRELDPG
jgi:hypothetical protein